MRWLSIVVILFAAITTFAQTDEKLREELLAMRERDQAAREACDKGTTEAVKFLGQKSLFLL